MPLDIHIASIDMSHLSRIKAKLEWYAKVEPKVPQIMATISASPNKTVALELISEIYGSAGTQNTIDKMNVLLRAIKIDQRHDFDDEGNRCSGGIDVNFIQFPLGTIADELKARYITPPNSKVELISPQTELTGLKYYCMDIGMRDWNARKLEDNIVKTLQDEIDVGKAKCCSKISTISQIIDSAGCAYEKKNDNSYNPAECKFCDTELIMYNIGYIFYQGFFEYFGKKDIYCVFKYLPNTSKTTLASMNDATQKKVSLALYGAANKTELTSSSCTIGQQGFSVKGICAFLNNDKGMFEPQFVQYITTTVAGNKELKRLLKATTCMSIKGYGDFGQLIVISYLNCIAPYINNIILLTCDRFLAYIACILECPFMLGTTVDACYLYDASAKLQNEYIVDVWNMSARNIKIICPPLHNPAQQSQPAHYNLKKDISALIVAQQTHINTDRALNSQNKTIIYINKSNKLLKVDELVKQFNEEETRLYRLYINDYAIIYDRQGGAGGASGGYKLYDISPLLSTDVEAVFKEPTAANIGKHGLTVILEDIKFLKTPTPATGASSSAITLEKYTATTYPPPFNSINLLRKYVEQSATNYNIFITIKVFTEGLKAKQDVLREYTGYAGSSHGITNNISTFAIYNFSFNYEGFKDIGYLTKKDVEAKMKTEEGYLEILEHGIKSVKKPAIGAFNKFLTTFKKKNACSNTLDSPEILLDDFPNLCNLYINELNTILTNLRHIKALKDSSPQGSPSKGSPSKGVLEVFLKKTVAYYEVVKASFNYLIQDFFSNIGENIVPLIEPFYVLEYYINLCENPNNTYITPSMVKSQSELQKKEASLRLAFKQLNLNILKSIVDFIENINNRYNFVKNDVKEFKDDLIAKIEGLIKATGNHTTYGGAILKIKNGAKPAKPLMRGGMPLTSLASRYDTNLTEIQYQTTDNCCGGTGGGSSDATEDDINDSKIDMLKYNEYLDELKMILEYLYGGSTNAEEELTLWNVFCYYYYIIINKEGSVSKTSSVSKASSVSGVSSVGTSKITLQSIKTDVFFWETFKRNYPIYQYIIEYQYFTKNNGLLYRYIRGEGVLTPSTIEASEETRLIIERYNGFVKLEAGISYYIQEYNVFEREKVAELTKAMNGAMGNLYGMYDIEKMLERRRIQRALFRKPVDDTNLQRLLLNSPPQYELGIADKRLLKEYMFNNTDKNNERIVSNLSDELSHQFLMICLFDTNDTKGMLEYIKDVRLNRLIYAIETKAHFLSPHIIEHLSDTQFKEIIRTHLAYIEPPMIYHLRAGQLLEFLVGAPIDTRSMRNYMGYASIHTLERVISIERNTRLIERLPLTQFEIFVKKDVRYFPYLAEEQRAEFLLAHREYIVYAGEQGHPVGKYITASSVLQLLSIDPSAIRYLSLNNTWWFIETYREVIEINNIYIGLLSDNQVRYMISSHILPKMDEAGTKYILKYMRAEDILKYIKNNTIRINERHLAILQELTPEQLIHIINGVDRDDRDNLIRLLSPVSQFLILQKAPQIIKFFTEGQIDSLVALNFITPAEVKEHFIRHSLENGSMLSYLKDDKLIEYTNAEPRLYGVLSMHRLSYIYDKIRKMAGGDDAVLKLLYYLNAEYKGAFLERHPKILIKYHTYIQYLTTSQIYGLLKRFVMKTPRDTKDTKDTKGTKDTKDTKDTKSSSGARGTKGTPPSTVYIEADFSILGDESYVLERYEKIKVYIQYMTDDQITAIISKRWITDISSSITEKERKEVEKYHDRYAYLLLQGITGVQAAHLSIFNPTHHPRLYIYYISNLTEDARGHFIRNLGINKEQKEQLIKIIREHIYYLKYCSPAQITECLEVINPVIPFDLIKDMSDDQIEVIIKFSPDHHKYINYMSLDSLYSFIEDNKEYIKILPVDRQYKVILNDARLITYILPEQVPAILEMLKKDKGSSGSGSGKGSGSSGSKGKGSGSKGSKGKGSSSSGSKGSKGSIRSYMDNLSGEQLKYLYKNKTGGLEEPKNNKRYLRKLLDHDIDELIKNPKYISGVPEVIKDAYLDLLSKKRTEGYADIIYDAIYKYDRTYFNLLDVRRHLTPILKSKPAYIASIPLAGQLYFIKENWMYIQYLSLSVKELKRMIVKREDPFIRAFLRNKASGGKGSGSKGRGASSSGSKGSRASSGSKSHKTFDIIRFILEMNCSYINYLESLNKEQQAKFKERYPEMKDAPFFNMYSGYYEAEDIKEIQRYTHIKTLIYNMESFRKVADYYVDIYKKRVNISAIQNDIIISLSNLTSINNIVDVLKILSKSPEFIARDMLYAYIHKKPLYIHYLSKDMKLEIIKADPNYIQFLEVEDIPDEYLGNKRYTTEGQRAIIERLKQKGSKKST